MEEAAANTGETDRRNVGDSLRSAAKFRRGDCRRGNRLDKRGSLVRAQYRPLKAPFRLVFTGSLVSTNRWQPLPPRPRQSAWSTRSFSTGRGGSGGSQAAPLHIDAFDDRDELVSSIAVPARARSTRSLAAATTVPQSGVAATVIPRPRRKSSRQLPILRNQPGVSLRRRRCSLRQRPE